MMSAPAKVILFGEHAVVYGQPAIAAPVSSLRARATFQASPAGSGLVLVTLGGDEDISRIPIDPMDVNSAFSTTVRLVLNYFQRPAPNGTIVIESEIPIASGLGSGAAVTTALARAVAEALEKTLPLEDLNALVFEVEKFYHGTPSGIDNTVIVYETPIYFIKNHVMDRLVIGAPFAILIADTGVAASTKTAVSDVRRFYTSRPDRVQPLLSSIGAITNRARQAIEDGDIASLGPLMMQNHAVLRTLGVSSPALENLVDTALKAGALGAKLSGGGRGGNMIALTTPELAESVERSLIEAGAVRVYKTTLG